jgi:CO/xanthine dehydrogenase FAD-binding subunit
VYHAPTNLHEALRIASEGRAKIIAGGTDVYPSTKQGKFQRQFLDVTRISELKQIALQEDCVRVGAAVSWTQVINADLPPAFLALQEAAREVGSIQIQNAGTVAGNLCNASPAADGVPPLLVLDASVEIASSARGTRVVPLSDFILGVRRTALAPDELVTAILVPAVPANLCSAFEKLGSRRYLVISITMVAALVGCNSDGSITEARIAVGACSPVAQRLLQLEASLIGQRVSEVNVDMAHLLTLAPIDDVRGSKEFRLNVVAEQCRRAIDRAAGHARSH